jgi:hypothetical protein
MQAVELSRWPTGNALVDGVLHEAQQRRRRSRQRSSSPMGWSW